MDCANAIDKAIEYLDLAHGDGNAEVNEVIATLQAIIKQRGMESNNLHPGAALLTQVMDTAIFG
jgi:hypothetical protein